MELIKIKVRYLTTTALIDFRMLRDDWRIRDYLCEITLYLQCCLLLFHKHHNVKTVRTDKWIISHAIEHALAEMFRRRQKTIASIF